ncbi:DUF2298 domain-containing protein [Dehalococcoidia bacterium]|nr:DUF2298 domain-containing protein [Dehalococcoidia bacterium]
MRAKGNTRAVPPALFVILIIALGLRLNGIGWDQGNFFHPDERSIYMRVDCMHRLLTSSPGYQACIQDAPFRSTVPGFPNHETFLSPSKSPLNPHWFPLGTLIIYVLLAIKMAAAPIVAMDLVDLAVVGRTLTAFSDVGTIAMVYILGRRLYGNGAGLLAATLVTFAVIHIQQSHFYRPETFTNLFTLAAFWSMLQVLERQRVRDSVCLGLFVGLCFATKVSVLSILLPTSVVYGLLLYKAIHHSSPNRWITQSHKESGSNSLQEIRCPDINDQANHIPSFALRGIIGGVVAIVIYVVCTPYAILDFRDFLEWNFRELAIVREAGTVPYTVQYIGAPKFLYELTQTISWGLGIPLGLLAWGGLLSTVILNIRKPKVGQVLMLLWAIPLLLTVVSVEVKFLRYTFPLMPVMILMGSGVAYLGIQSLSRNRPIFPLLARGTVGMVVVTTAFYALSFESIYSRPHTAVQASEWVNANVPYTTAILTDNHWDEGIPNLGRYRVSQLPMFEGDSANKMKSVASKLASAEYLIFYSNRTYGAIARTPERYPFSSSYYRLLFSGDLGYRLEKSFSSYPRFLGVTFVDNPFSRAGVPTPELIKTRNSSPLTLNLGYADNDAITYDHPLVLVFRNEDKQRSEQLLDLLLTPAVPNEAKTGSMLTTEEWSTQQNGGTWSQLFNQNSLANRFPVLTWIFLVEAISLITLPLGFIVFHGLRDRGYLLTKSMAILLLAYFPWLMASLGIMDYGGPSIYLGMIGMTALGAVIVTLRLREMVAFVRHHWRILAFEEVLFIVVFLAFLCVQWANPDLWHPFRGGEKPMDFAYLNAIVKSTVIPPYDPWFAGGYLNYYYFGQFVIATLIKATGILPETAYNVAIPLLFALTASGSFSVVYNLTQGLRKHLGVRGGPSWGPVTAGVGAVFLVAILGNLHGAIQLIQYTWNALMFNISFPTFDFWAASRMMPGQISITEFPYWTFLFGDLHAHLIAIPFTLLAIGLSLSLFMAAGWSNSRKRNWVIPSVALAIIVGSLAAMNTWDYPTYLLLTTVIFFLAFYTHQSNKNAISSDTNGTNDMIITHRTFLQGLDRLSVIKATLWGGVLVGSSYLAFLPFHLHHATFNAGIHASAEQTDVHHYLAIHGLFVVTVASYLVYECGRYLMRILEHQRSAETQRFVVTDNTWLFIWKRALIAVILACLTISLIYLVTIGYATVVLLLLFTSMVVFISVGRLKEGTDVARYHLFLIILLWSALTLGIAVDIVTVNNDIDRMNTVFKLYLQAWVLYGLASATILWYLLTRAFSRGHRFNLRKSIWVGFILLLLTSTTVFPILGTRSRLADRFATTFTGLNGAQYMQDATYRDVNGPIELRWDWDAIQWLRTNVEGSPVVAEGNTSPHQYRWGSRVSIYTGLPTIVGWDWHQTQQRYGEQKVLRSRLSQVSTLFSTSSEDQAAQILRDYNVRYIYVGKLERLYYPLHGLAKFKDMAGRGVTLVYSNPEVDIYEVDLAQL